MRLVWNLWLPEESSVVDDRRIPDVGKCIQLVEGMYQLSTGCVRIQGCVPYGRAYGYNGGVSRHGFLWLLVVTSSFEKHSDREIWVSHVHRGREGGCGWVHSTLWTDNHGVTMHWYRFLGALRLVLAASVGGRAGSIVTLIHGWNYIHWVRWGPGFHSSPSSQYLPVASPSAKGDGENYPT